MLTGPGTGAHTNYSTNSMRADGGIKVIEEAIQKLSRTHVEHITQYGLGNEMRLTGKHEVSGLLAPLHCLDQKWSTCQCSAETDSGSQWQLCMYLTSLTLGCDADKRYEHLQIRCGMPLHSAMLFSDVQCIDKSIRRICCIFVSTLMGA